MRRATAVLLAGTLAALLSACGTNDIASSGSFTTPAVTAPTATKASIATATAIPATATLTSAATPTATQISVPTPTATVQVQAVVDLRAMHVI